MIPLNYKKPGLITVPVLLYAFCYLPNSLEMELKSSSSSP